MSDPLKTCHFIEKTGNWMTPRGRSTFVAVAKKFKNKTSKRKDDEGAYILTLIIPPGSDLNALVKAVNDTAAESSHIGAGKKGWSKPFIKAEEKEIKGLEDVDLTGWVMLRANTYRARPGVVDRSGKPIEFEALEKECYSGRWMRMSVRPHAYPAQDGGTSGVKFYLGNIQLLDDDEQLGGFTAAAAEDEFGEIGESGGGTAASMFDD